MLTPPPPGAAGSSRVGRTAPPERPSCLGALGVAVFGLLCVSAGVTVGSASLGIVGALLLVVGGAGLRSAFRRPPPAPPAAAAPAWPGWAATVVGRGQPEQVCPYCRERLGSEELAGCAGCGAVYHSECAWELPGCAALGCGGRRGRERARG